MSHGTPVLAPERGGVIDWLEDGINGFFIEPRDPKAIARKIGKLLENEEQFLKMSECASESARRFTEENHYAKLLGAYKAD